MCPAPAGRAAGRKGGVMELKIKDGDYVKDGAGGLTRVDGGEKLLQRVLFLLTAHRGCFPFLPDLGSRLYLLGQTAPAKRQSAAQQYVAEALLNEADLTVKTVTLQSGEAGAGELAVSLNYGGTDLSVTMSIQG